MDLRYPAVGLREVFLCPSPTDPDLPKKVPYNEKCASLPKGGPSIQDINNEIKRIAKEVCKDLGLGSLC